MFHRLISFFPVCPLPLMGFLKWSQHPILIFCQIKKRSHHKHTFIVSFPFYIYQLQAVFIKLNCIVASLFLTIEIKIQLL